MATRDTPYATEIASATFTFPSGSEARIERLFVKDQGQDEIRFSWWKDGRMMMRPLDLSEKALVALIREAIAQQVFSPEFLADLHEVLEQR